MSIGDMYATPELVLAPKDPVEQGGKRASLFGKQTEASVQAHLKEAGFVELGPKEKRSLRLSTAELAAFGPKWYARNVKKYPNIYGVGSFSDFVVYHHTVFPYGLVLEVKTQDSPGSVDEKYVFTVLSLIAIPEVESWIVFEGSGARECAIQWMKAQSEKKNRFTFLTFAEFRRKLYDRINNPVKHPPPP